MIYLVCPECTKRGVTLRERQQEDHYGCRYCDWYAFTGGDSPTDKRELERLWDANPSVKGER